MKGFRRQTIRVLVLAVIFASLVGGFIGSAVSTYVAQTSGRVLRARDSTDQNRGYISEVASDITPAVVQIESLERGREGSGSGVIISRDGQVLTNSHVVSSENTESYFVTTSDRRTFEVEEIVRDDDNDLAIIKLKAENLHAVRIGDSDSVKTGEEIIAVGNPFGSLKNTVTSGIVSGTGRVIMADDSAGSFDKLDNLIQIDAAVNPGSSGGPLVNLAGEVIGINVASDQFAENIGFAVPINSAKGLIFRYRGMRILNSEVF